VTSSVLELVPREASFDPAARDRALRFASLAFRFRRKTLVNALSSAADRSQVARALQDIGRGARARAEELSLDDYLELAARVEAA
jgi:16S rRNA A1518/A1519 N6-dimethyltransferase RsmA/KsgA/DIM1 with predicted DNA glycosylase/AP lyase activity